MRHRAYIGIGSNQGAKVEHCERALRIMSTIPETAVAERSPLFESEPWGGSGEWYVNGVCAVDTNLEPATLLGYCHGIERRMGRRRSGRRWEDRVIDLDLLLFDDRVVDDPGLEVPHPELEKRKFVLVPMCEIAPEAAHPVLRMNMAQLLARVEDPRQVLRIYHDEVRL